MCEVRLQHRRHGRAESVLLDVVDGTTLLDAACRAGLPVARSCDGGALCARCGVSVLEGAERLSAETPAESEAKLRNRIPAELRLACLCRIHGPVAVTASYW